jgi:hypothetical protein
MTDPKKKPAKEETPKAKKKPQRSKRNYFLNGKKYKEGQELTPAEVKLFEAAKCEFIT